MGFVQVHRAAADSKVSVFGHASVALTIEVSRFFLAEEWARTLPKPDAFRVSAIVRRGLGLK
jgi:hypothetical protein